MEEPKTWLTKPDDIPFATSGIEAPTFFVDYIRGTLISSGVVKLNFVENKLDAMEKDVKSTHVVTLVTPIDQIRAWARYLNELADQQGVPPLQAVAGSSQAVANGQP
jgi:hypothetical protein